jgi:diguanylate cyclase (GGDEF)-like protein
MTALTIHEQCVAGHRAGDRSVVLVVGDAAFAQRVRGVAERCGGTVAVECVPSLVWAMGRVRQCVEPIIIVPASEAPSSGPINGHLAHGRNHQAVWTALRRQCPGLRLWVHVAGPHAPDALRTAAAGVDELLLDPVTDDDLIMLLRPTPAAAVPAQAEPVSDDSQAELGDVDLVELLLASTQVEQVSGSGACGGGASGSETSGGVVELALRMIRRQSGLAQTTWHADPRDAPKDHCSAVVRFRGHDLGVLHAPPGITTPAPGIPAPGRVVDTAQTTAALEGWAAWLARWLALEARLGQLQRLALRDDLTGVWNRRYFHRFLQRVLADAADQRRQVTLLVFDIDDFKIYNDKYGHGAGDDILREAARLMQSAVRAHDVVARIGGDEFAVIFWDKAGPRKPDSQHPQDVLAAAKRFQKAICTHSFPKLLQEAPGTLTISGGLATYPWDGRTPQDLLERADAMALTSKRQGKNAITFGPGAAKACAAKSLRGDVPQTPAAPAAS